MLHRFICWLKGNCAHCGRHKIPWGYMSSGPEFCPVCDFKL